MGSLSVDDQVYGSDGKPQRILGKSIPKMAEIYEVEFNDGEKVRCDGGHRWFVKTGDGQRSSFRVLTTEQMFLRENGHKVRYLRSGKLEISDEPIYGRPNKRMHLPRTPAVQMDEKEFTVHPYVLGLWLGDGHSSQAIITASNEDILHTRSMVESFGYVTTDQSTPCTFGIRDLKTRLRDLGVLGNKHIPDEYLLGSIEQRMDLIRGLMDSDGNVSKAGQCFFSQKDEKIIRSFRKILWSLGIKNTLSVTEYVESFGKRYYGPYYKVSFYKHGVATIPRKLSRTIDPDTSSNGKLIINSIKKLGYSEMVQCISVSNEDELFLTGENLFAGMNTKSEFASYLFPAWMLGKKPDIKIIQATHTADLAKSFGAKVKDLIDTDEIYKEIFPDVSLKKDEKAAGKWKTSSRGEYYAVGVGGALAGRGADLCVIDDPVSEQSVITTNDKAMFQACYDWYLTGPRQRLQPGAALVVVMTRWSKLDLCGRILDKAREDGELHEWEVIELPAILESGNPLWPGYWSLRELDKLKKELPVSRWSAQYMQQPVSQASSIIKRDWWKPWPHDHPPKCEYVIQSWDTAFTAKEAADPSACVELGVFYMDAPNGNKQANIIVLDAFQKRMEFPELKEEAWARYKLKEPDTVLIEGRSSGVPLIQELRMRGLPIQEFSGSVRGNDKTARVNSISDLFSSGVVWYPEGKKFADEIITQFEDFPVGVHDDLVDATTQALIRFRMGGFLPLDTDYEDEEDYEPVIANYY